MLSAPLALLMSNAAAEVEHKEPPVIDIDGTVLVQFALFLLMYVLLKRLLFDPYLQMRDARSRRIEGVREEAESMERDAAALAAEYERRMLAARNQADSERQRLRGAGQERERELLTETRAAVAQKVSGLRQQLEQQVGTARQQLRAQAQPLARQIARQILGREV